MAKNKKEVIEITDEGIIAVDGLVADFEYLYDKIKTKSCDIVMTNKASYLCLLVPFEHWLSDRVSEEEFKKTVAYIKNEWQKNLEWIKMVEPEDIIKISKENGYKSIRLLASVNNIAANKLYQRIGFKNKGKVRLYNNEYIAYEYVMV